ncbi:pyruvate, phosphate dikinase [Spiractinospora alimapuensis]|uniref:PEP/pyruvate-binding domain-containing protein n=1 Tax=Spiractinospora alimapuensis TaxID=2820884 RepID=UPI001EEBD832|nr:PEP/pyruvate-binding domain-containing protein [Spiractinospora alimapuensis]QVQ50890.1 pyruvate, phosphate dikinase [Spiractinospora alimapuensis]
MSDNHQHVTVLPLDDPKAELERVGGKGASLARLVRAGVPVPDGFCVTTDAYARFVDGAELREPILAAVSTVDLEAPETMASAQERIAHLFRTASIPDAIADDIRAAYAGLGGGSVAVRSSATAEDLPEHSFAGQQDTFLNISGDDALLRAVRDCWASLWTARAIGYRARAGITPESVSLAVVVQTLVPADAAGVAFTADPVTGTRGGITINAAWGLGEAVVSGAVNADTVVVDRATWNITDRRTADKSVMTVRDTTGTHEAPVPKNRRSVDVLDSAEARELAALCTRVEELYGTPMDVEWARHDNDLYILQARPITTVVDAGDAVEREEWNDSALGDFLWTSANVGEAVPSVMTPMTWTFFTRYIGLIKPQNLVPGVPMFGNIGGRLYMNVSMMASMGAGEDTIGEQITGPLPSNLTIPPAMPRRQVATRIAPPILRTMPSLLPFLRRTSERLAASHARMSAARTAIRAARTPADLARLWDLELDPCFTFVTRTFWGTNAKTLSQFTLRRWLGKIGVDEEDVNALASGGGDDSDDAPMASLGPLIGLAQLSRGEIDQRTFVDRWGHRCPDELELSEPRPVEAPDWLDAQLAAMGDSVTQVTDLLKRQREEREQAVARFAQRHPTKVGALRRRMAASAVGTRSREAGRSEWVRMGWVQREFVLRAGELTGHGDDLFFLDVDELVDVLRGDERPLNHVPSRRAAYDHYRSLPTYPLFIRGRFAPDRWAADPNRRGDIFDEHRDAPPPAAEISGAPGSRGVVEGTVRVIGSMAESESVLPGEILVTTITNVGWTPLFPRLAAVVTDVGAPLSHAAIVARELGIPAVVGCGDATTRLTTGDRVRVNGVAGTVEVLRSATEPEPAPVAQPG